MDIHNIKTGFNLLGVNCSIVDEKVLCINLDQDNNRKAQLNNWIIDYLLYRKTLKWRYSYTDIFYEINGWKIDDQVFNKYAEILFIEEK